MDLAIVATTAEVRSALVSNICEHSDIRYWVLEKVLTQSEGDIIDLQNILGAGKSV
jgi:hypothetical protein